MVTEFHYTVETVKTLEEAVNALERSLQNRKFGVLWQLDVPAKLQEKGVAFDRPYRILEVCNPHEAKQVLSSNPMVGYFLPCKVVVYEQEGRTVIGLPKPTALMEVIGDPGLTETAQRVENILKEAVDEAAGR